MPVDWAIFFTTIGLAILGFIWAQSRKIDIIHQALFGVNGKNGVLRSVQALNVEARTVDERIVDSRHDLAGKMQIEIAELNASFIERTDDIKRDLSETRRDYIQRFEEVKLDIRDLRARKR